MDGKKSQDSLLIYINTIIYGLVLDYSQEDNYNELTKKE